MKKIFISAAIAAALIAGTTAPSFAAAKKIGTAKTAGAEGTATHEMSESSSTQKSEGTAPAKKMTTKKVAVKKSAKK
jgi:hypothetical protein